MPSMSNSVMKKTKTWARPGTLTVSPWNEAYLRDPETIAHSDRKIKKYPKRR